MFFDKDLNNHLTEAETVRLQSAIIAEWNMNSFDNISAIGNYRYRPLANKATDKYAMIIGSYDPIDSGNFYTNATYADVVIDGGYENQLDANKNPVPQLFLSKKEKERLLYSLEECFGRFRPRSGINKARFGVEPGVLHHTNTMMFDRPRYYLSDKNDKFKYWTSFRTEFDGASGLIDRGIANQRVADKYYIDDAAPFVVYNTPIPANRVVVKMQTNVGNIDLGPFANESGTVPDPLYGDANKTVPVRWRIQGLFGDSWADLIKFDEGSLRKDGSAIIKSDGYVEVGYGLIVPQKYTDVFVYMGEYTSENLLPKNPEIGNAFWVRRSENDLGRYLVYTGNGVYDSFTPSYGWKLLDEDVTTLTNFVTDLTSPKLHASGISGNVEYTEFQYLGGLRVVVETMNKMGTTFDLIELSPRLAVDLSEKTIEYSITKSASDLGVSGMPVGQLLAATGTLSLFDYDEAFNPNNKTSIVSAYKNKNIQIKMYEVISNVEVFNESTKVTSPTDFYVPIKTMYVEGFPTYSSKDRQVSISLRDMYFYLESVTAPQIVIQDASLSYAVSLLLDNIGFSNYTFKRVDGESDPIIPYFYIAPDRTVAEVLQDLAISTQTAMFFDEYNNLVFMSKDYIMPSEADRGVDLVLYGSQDQNAYRTSQAGNIYKLENIIDVASQDSTVYNDGKITYSSKYIQKTNGSINQAYVLDRDRTWVYKPSLLWEVSGSQNTKSINNEVGSQSDYVLSAIPLNSDLSDQIPTVVNHEIINNIIDLGESVYWMSRYNGYLYANGEIIKYDAIEYTVTGSDKTVNNVWITSTKDYQNYFSKLPFNGKIYPTGRVRIYAEPNYETFAGIDRLLDGSVAKHGRMQFGTGIEDLSNPGQMKPVYHYAGLSENWGTSNEYVRGCKMKSKYLFALSAETVLPNTDIGEAGTDKVLAMKMSRTGLIKNFLSSSIGSELDNNKVYSKDGGTVQASALSLSGPAFAADQSAIDFISYVYKPLPNSFRHFGTRMRIIGKIENNDTSIQTASGATSYYTSPKNIAGGGGGLAFMINPETNNGYYFELAALSEGNMANQLSKSDAKNVLFYKIMKNTSFDVKSLSNISGVWNGVSLTAETNSALSINGSAAVLGQRVLLDAQEKEVEKGYYVVTNPGSSEKKWELTRDEEAIPVQLWSGLSQILVDNGNFTGQGRVSAESTPTVYDLAVEYQDIGTTRRFYLYLNNVQIATADDKDPLPIWNNIAPFVRGTSRCMFEHLYALTQNYSQDASFALTTVANSAFGDNEITVNESFRKYAMNGMIQSTYLSGISPSSPPKYNIYFEEFGTIMREASYFNVRYDKAYPALYAKLAPTFNKVKGYTVSGFFAGAYGAEFLVFNSTDTVLNLDATSGNYLRILGIALTQDSQNELKVDDFFSKTGDLSNPEIIDGELVYSILSARQNYKDIKSSRLKYGKKEFTLNAPYIQNQDDATNMMQWMISKIMHPRKSLGIRVFASPTIQLGDIVKVFMKSKDIIDADGNPVDELALEESRFVVYNISYSRRNNGPEMIIYLSEVI